MANSEWDLGQALVERGVCTLDQVREALSIQDRMRQMGVAPKPLAEILLEKGYAREEQLAAAGALVVPRKPAPPRPPPVRRRPVPRRSLAPVAWLLAVAALAGFGIVVVPRLLERPERGSTPSAPVGNPEREAAERAAQEDLDRIVAFQRSVPDFSNGGEVARRYAEYQKKHAGKKWELEAQGRFREYREQADRFARPELEEIQKRDSDLRAQGRFGELLALYRKFPAKFLETTDSGKTVAERVAELAQKMKETFLREKAETEKLLREGKFPEAQARVRSLEANAGADELKEIADLKARIDHESRARSMRRRQAVADEYLKADGDFKKALSLRDPRLAAGVVRRFLFEPRAEEDLGFIRVAGTDYESLRKALEEWRPADLAALCETGITDAETPDKLPTGEAALLDLRAAAYVAIFLREFDAAYQAAVASKELLEMPGLGRGRFEKRDKGTVFVLEGGTVLQADTHPMTDPDRVYLALKGRGEEAAALARAGFYYYYCCAGEALRAYRHLTEAQKRGARGVRLYVAALHSVTQAELARSLRTKFGAAETVFKARNWVAARKLIEEMLEYAEHPFTKEQRPLIEKMLADLAEAMAQEKSLSDLYRAKVEPAGEKAVRVTYDFEGREQIEAFEIMTDDGERKFKGRWRLDRGMVESSVEASVLRWKTKVKGDVAVEYDLVPLEDPQNIVLDLYYNKGAARHYAVILGFDWVGKADGDRDNSAEDRFGMPRTCVIKYPVAVDKARWVLADHWENWTSRLVGGPKGAAWRPAKGKGSRLRVERQGKAVRLFADKALVWEGADDAYSEGNLLFFSDSRCRLDNLSITFTP